MYQWMISIENEKEDKPIINSEKVKYKRTLNKGINSTYSRATKHTGNRMKDT